MLRQAQHEREKWWPLVAHPNAPSNKIRAIEAQAYRMGTSWVAGFMVQDAPDLRLPQRLLPPHRADGLWKNLCFELFVRPRGENRYFEFNFSPSRQWAAYAFDTYRSGMHNLPLAESPDVRGVLGAKVDLADLNLGECDVGLCAVIEETDGTKSYWALRHPPGLPDFHHPDCFALELPALAKS